MAGIVIVVKQNRHGENISIRRVLELTENGVTVILNIPGAVVGEVLVGNEVFGVEAAFAAPIVNSHHLEVEETIGDVFRIFDESVRKA